jgi:hypothetical protein
VVQGHKHDFWRLCGLQASAGTGFSAPTCIVLYCCIVLLYCIVLNSWPHRGGEGHETKCKQSLCHCQESVTEVHTCLTSATSMAC